MLTVCKQNPENDEILKDWKNAGKVPRVCSKLEPDKPRLPAHSVLADKA